MVGPATHEISSSKVKRKRKNRKNNKFNKMVQFLEPCGIGPSECQYIVKDLMSVSNFAHLPCHFTLSCPCFFPAQGPPCCQWWGRLPHCNFSFSVAAKSDRYHRWECVLLPSSPMKGTVYSHNFPPERWNDNRFIPPFIKIPRAHSFKHTKLNKREVVRI